MHEGDATADAAEHPFLDKSEAPSKAATKSSTPDSKATPYPVLVAVILAALAVGYGLGIGRIEWLQGSGREQKLEAAQKFHRLFIRLPNNDSAAEHLRELVKEPHISGSPEDLAA